MTTNHDKLEKAVTEPLIRIEHLDFAYDHEKNVLEDINLTLEPGRVVLVTGHSGSGKSTLLSVVNGVIPNVTGGLIRGTVRVAGLEPERAGLGAVGRVAGTLMQDPESQFFALSVGDELTFGLRARGVAFGDAERRARTAAARMGVESEWTRDIHVLSEGQKQLTGMAGLLALGPKVVLLDEPTANLDEAGRAALAHVLKEVKAGGRAVLVADHRLEWLRGVADEVILMESGRITARGTLEEIAGRAGVRELSDEGAGRALR
ncbi:energy-coupling factor ABC transporter ATP-binding protein, partial [Sutterella parvirubra]